MKKYNASFIEIILLHEYSHVNVLRFYSRTPFFRDHIWGSASVHRSKYKVYECRGSL